MRSGCAGGSVGRPGLGIRVERWRAAPSRRAPGCDADGPVDTAHNIKVLINGKRFAIAALVGGADNYLPINAGRLRVEARWQGNARGSGYYVVISTTEPQRRDYKTCSAGTSCLVSQKAQILAGQEMTWTVRIIKTQGKRLAAGFKVCLVGRA